MVPNMMMSGSQYGTNINVNTNMNVNRINFPNKNQQEAQSPATIPGKMRPYSPPSSISPSTSGYPTAQFNQIR